MRGCTRGVRTEGGSQPEGAPQGKPRGKGRAEAEGALGGEQSAGSSFFTREGADDIQDTHFSSISGYTPKSFFSISVSKFCMDKYRGLEKRDKTRRRERSCFMASLLLLYKLFRAIHRAKGGKNRKLQKSKKVT